MSSLSQHDKRQIRIKRKNARAQKAQQCDFIFGLHAVQAALAPATTRITELWLADERDDVRVAKLISAGKQHGIDPKRVKRLVMDEMIPDVNHQGVIARCRPLVHLGEKDLFALLAKLDMAPFLLVLDGVQDPHNLGACIRTAYAAGVHAVIAPKDRASGLTHVAIKVSSGAAECLPFIQVTNIARVLRQLKQQGVWIVGASSQHETSIFTADLQGALALVLGGEGGGIRRLTSDHCDQLVSIPMQAHAESLNVSVAAGVCLFEATRQRDLRLTTKIK